MFDFFKRLFSCFKKKEEKKVPVTEVPLNKGKICINNGIKNKYIGKDEPIPEGWVLGGKKRVKKK